MIVIGRECSMIQGKSIGKSLKIEKDSQSGSIEWLTLEYIAVKENDTTGDTETKRHRSEGNI
jgi:hypothetical protein